MHNLCFSFLLGIKVVSRKKFSGGRGQSVFWEICKAKLTKISQCPDKAPFKLIVLLVLFVDSSSGYSSVLLAHDQYTSKPDIDEQIKRQQFSGTELLRRGTKFYSNDFTIGEPVSSPTTEQRKNVDASACSSDTVVITERGTEIKTEKSRYATEGPFPASNNAPTHPPKNKTSSVGAENDRRVVYSSSKNSRFVVEGENEFLSAISSSERVNETTDFYGDSGKSKQKVESSISVLSSSGRNSSVKWSDYRPGSQVSSDVVPDECKQKGIVVVSEKETDVGDEFHGSQVPSRRVLDTQKCCSGDTPSNVARTRVYQRKSKLKAKEQDDICSGVKRSRFEDRGKSLLVKNQGKMEANGNRKKVRVDEDILNSLV